MTDKEEVCYNLCRECGDIAQLGERCVRIAEVGGSNPPISTWGVNRQNFYRLRLFFVRRHVGLNSASVQSIFGFTGYLIFKKHWLNNAVSTQHIGGR